MLWDRAQLKAEAKMKLKLFYWSGLLVCLIYSFLGGGFSSGGSGNVVSKVTTNSSTYEYHNYHSIFSPAFFLVIFFWFVIIVLISTIINIFLTSPILIGVYSFFMKSRERKTEITEILAGFRKGSYLNVVGTMFVMNLFVFLWSLLFLIPGIIKAYEYRMVPYILSENPHINRTRAFQLSKEMMMGEKWNTFVLDLSFLGWYFLGALCCGIGTLFVMPYQYATNCELYAVLRDKVLNSGFAGTMDFPGYFPTYQDPYGNGQW